MKTLLLGAAAMALTAMPAAPAVAHKTGYRHVHHVHQQPRYRHVQPRVVYTQPRIVLQYGYQYGYNPYSYNPYSYRYNPYSYRYGYNPYPIVGYTGPIWRMANGLYGCVRSYGGYGVLLNRYTGLPVHHSYELSRPSGLRCR